MNLSKKSWVYVQVNCCFKKLLRNPQHMHTLPLRTHHAKNQLQAFFLSIQHMYKQRVYVHIWICSVYLRSASACHTHTHRLVIDIGKGYN